MGWCTSTRRHWWRSCPTWTQTHKRCVGGWCVGLAGRGRRGRCTGPDAWPPGLCVPHACTQAAAQALSARDGRLPHALMARAAQHLLARHPTAAKQGWVLDGWPRSAAAAAALIAPQQPPQAAGGASSSGGVVPELAGVRERAAAGGTTPAPRRRDSVGNLGALGGGAAKVSVCCQRADGVRATAAWCAAAASVRHLCVEQGAHTAVCAQNTPRRTSVVPAH
jgi:hypothetical protein